MAASKDPLDVDAALLCKLASIVGHVEEAASADGHAFDLIAAKSLISDPAVRDWLKAMRDAALAPLPRRKGVGSTPFAE